MHLLLLSLLDRVIIVVKDLLLELVHGHVLLINFALIHVANHGDLIVTGLVHLRHVVVIACVIVMRLGGAF